MRLGAACLAVVLLGCGEQRVELFDGSPPSDAPVVDLTLRDPVACGTPPRHCEDEEYCVAGACVCRPPLTRIGERCVDTNADGAHCGPADMTCALCVDGACGTSCPLGTTECLGGCVDLRTHPLHCGECERPCESDHVCVEGRCVTFAPAPCTSCPCGCTQSCCSYPEHPTDTICVAAAECE